MRSRPAKPLEPVSETTKNKLNAFNFAPPVTGAANPDRTETAPSNDENTTRHDGNDKSISAAEVALPGSEKSSVTPVSRLAWHDLIGAPQQRDDRQDVSPNEHILWDTRHDQSYKASPMIPRKKGKKRARSSSPTSSPAAKSKPKSNTPVVNVKKLAEALKSPHADPALELWDRFSLSGSTSATPLGTTNPALAQIMVSSSPQPLKMLGAIPAESGLRRTISCGAQWPKRRRTDRVDPVEPLEATVEESPSGASKSSMVNALLKSATGEINRSKTVQTCQETLSSPSPKKRPRHPTPSAPSSPSRPLSSSPLKRASLLLDGTNKNKLEQAKSTLRDSSASDYGDDDFDDDALMELDASLAAPGGEADDGDTTLLAPVPRSLDTGQKMEQPVLDEYLGSSDDEFADLDDDVFAVAEDLITQIDSNHTSTSNAKSLSQSFTAPQNQLGTVSEDSSEDIYGDDFGDFDFEAAEIAATQSAEQTQLSGSLPPVRRWQ